MSPKKPNSANRKVAKVKFLFNTNLVTTKIPGEGHTLQHYSIVLLSSCSIRDLIGVDTKAIRNKFDLNGVKNRKGSRSLYGVSKHAIS